MAGRPEARLIARADRGDAQAQNEVGIMFTDLAQSASSASEAGRRAIENQHSADAELLRGR
jgi:hypothetical protein